MASNRSGKIEELWPKLIEKKLVTALKIWKWDRALVIMGGEKCNKYQNLHFVVGANVPSFSEDIC